MHRPISAVREYAIADLTDATLSVEKKNFLRSRLSPVAPGVVSKVGLFASDKKFQTSCGGQPSGCTCLPNCRNVWSNGAENE